VSAPNIETIVSLAKRRGFVYPSSEIYGGLGSAWDYGPMGIELYNNVKQAWWRWMVYERDDIEGLDSSIILNSLVWKYSGHINLGGSDSRGNSVTSHTHLDTEVVAQREIFRVVAGATVNRATDRDQETESNALANVKYDRFITLKQFGYGNLTLEHDKFKDIRLRNTIGAGRGYDALTSPRTNLSIEGGPSYVFTDFYSSSDEHYPALRLALRFDHYLIPSRLQLFQQTEVFVGLDSLRKSFAHTKTGLRMPLRDNLVANVEYDVDWDGDPAPGRVSTDRNLLFSLGYQW